MKSFKILVVLFSYVLLSSCHGDDSMKLDKVNTVDGMSVGEYHNFLMDKQKTLFESHKISGEPMSKAVLNYMQNELKDELTARLNITSYEYDNFIEMTQIESVIDSDNEKMANSELSFKKQLDSALQNLNNDELANDLRQLLNKANMNNFREFESFSDSLNEKYDKTEYKVLINSVIDVSIHSYNYWNNSGTTYRGGGDGVWQADISGAVIGGSWGAVSGSFAGGMGALPGGLLGACIASSYGSAAAGFWSAF